MGSRDPGVEGGSCLRYHRGSNVSNPKLVHSFWFFLKSRSLKKALKPGQEMCQLHKLFPEYNGEMYLAL